VDLDLVKGPHTPPAAPTVYRLAYRISSIDRQVKDTVAYVGDPGFGTTPGQYKLEIPSHYYDSSRILDCVAGGGHFLKGFNPATGAAICWSVSALRCADGEIPKGVLFNFSTKTIEPYCVKTRQIGCASPTYRLSNFNPRYLDPSTAAGAGSAAAYGQCRYMAADQSAPRPAPATSSDPTPRCPEINEGNVSAYRLNAAQDNCRLQISSTQNATRVNP